jgi:hypothetical protein
MNKHMREQYEKLFASNEDLKMCGCCEQCGDYNCAKQLEDN